MPEPILKFVLWEVLKFKPGASHPKIEMRLFLKKSPTGLQERVSINGPPRAPEE
jgi:hypothetical protein